MIAYLKDKFSKISDSDTVKILFIVSMFFMLLIGIMLCYNFNFINNYNLLFDSDTSRVIGDMTELEFNHYRLSVHPLFVVIMQPIYFIIKGIVLNKMLALIVISSLATSLTIVFIYKILSIYKVETKTKLLISFCYLFSFSNYIFTAGIEVYNIAVLFLVILWYYALLKSKKSDFNRYSYFILIILGVLSIAFTITNVVIFLIILFLMLVFKKIKFRYILLVGIATVVISVFGIYSQKLIWHNTPTLGISNVTGEEDYADYSITTNKIVNVIKDDYYNSIVGNDVYVKTRNSETYLGNNYVISFEKTSVINIIVISIFYISLLVLLVRNFKHDMFSNIGIVLSLIFNSGLHVLYGNESAFLYSLHFLYLIFICYGINLSFEKNKTIKKFCLISLLLLLLTQFIFNNVYFVKILSVVRTILDSNYFVANFGIIISTIIAIILIITIFVSIYFIIKFLTKFVKTKAIDKKATYLILTSGLSIFIIIIFVALETTPIYNKIFWINTGSKIGEVSVNGKNKYLRIDKSELYKKYSSEIESLNIYEKEYQSFLNEYSHEKVDFLNRSNYFFFGLGNRRKLLYKDSQLIDIETNEKLYEFDIKLTEIIPNDYTVIIETTKGIFIKIVEDNYGVHIVTDYKNEIISGTDIYINLYEFKGQKYQNIKKVLYNEILFNIKDSVIYPNILVYSEPWYRDAAFACMVLKQTGNLDLIGDWVQNITNIYDEQNAGNKETDNLGELLYILSTQKNFRSDMVDLVKQEAQRIANSNSDGYYIYGTTDFGEEYLYQNLWYKFGIESLGEKSGFSIDGLTDDYSNMVWWMDCKMCGAKEAAASFNYPYISAATFHKSKLGKITVNENIYPLSWEKSASQANYENMEILGKFYSDNKISPLHTWAASEMLLLLLDDTGNL